MNRARTIGTAIAAGILGAAMSGLLVAGALAHCDSTSGPVIPEAQAALERGDLTPILKWVTKDNEAEIKTAFAKAVAVRGNGPEARELADRYFLETLVRLHRAGEGAPYTGITDEPVEPIIAMADQALAGGSAEQMIKALNDHLTGAVREKFQTVMMAARDKDKSVEAGRVFVEAYVAYVHYVESIHASMKSDGSHHVEAGQGADEHQH